MLLDAKTLGLERDRRIMTRHIVAIRALAAMPASSLSSSTATGLVAPWASVISPIIQTRAVFVTHPYLEETHEAQ